MPPQRGQSSRQSPACRFGVGGGRSRPLPRPRLTRPCAGSPLAPQALGTFRASSCAAQAAGTSSSSSEHGRARGGSEAGDIGGDTAGLLLRAPPAASRGGAITHPPAAGRPGGVTGILPFPSERTERRGKELLKPGKVEFFLEMRK